MVKKPPTSPRTTTPLSKRLIALTLVVACLFLLLFNTAVWFNRYIFSTEQFSTTALPALLSDSSTEAIASEVTDRLLADRPVLRSTINDRVVSLVAALLRTDLSTRIVEKSVTTLQISVTSKDPQVVAIDLSGIKNVIGQIVTLGRQLTDKPAEQQRIDVNDIPDQIVLFDPSVLPNIYKFGVVMLWMAPLTLLGALAVLVYPLYRAYWSGLAAFKQLLAVQGGAVLATGLLGLAIGPLVSPIVLAQVPSVNLRVVTENLIGAFISRFDVQTVWIMIVPGSALLLVALGIHLWPVVRSYRSSRANKASSLKA